jgi:uncharacterized protein YbjQ (UPF0145 family)
MILSTTATIAGRRIVKTLGLVRGSTIRSRAIGKDIMAFMRAQVGGEIHEYTKMLAESREQAIDRMIEEAQALGADSVVGVLFQTSMIVTGSAEIMCYGTAVQTEAE